VGAPTQQVKLPHKSLSKGWNMPIQGRSVRMRGRVGDAVHHVEVTFDRCQASDQALDRVVDRGRREELRVVAEVVHELSLGREGKGCALRGWANI